ncbi:hypothetical protein B9G69_011485 [Bdellovibrio sp. SKB1291214]|uniref:hypothetical protein n=1 Tax=Bdellovibrio sp. SKB1291214 TaxID=1732569 RepID=UPI00223F67DF|nr:hypothetical protein [Bdellovibrio sp. SKB1291214]UYL07669.1 hypothetical protein B9G69_011485 [Bdellovibrio sp. SKB1291214]
MKNWSILFLALVASSIAQAESRKPMLFQASRNNIQVLPQRFEYTLMDEDRLKVGDILIDSTKVTFDLQAPTKNDAPYKVRFTWPADLLKDGELAIKNNAGKAIFTTRLDQENVKISKNERDQENLRSDLASLTVELKDAKIVEDMKYLPFMTFCIYRQSEETQTYLCSKELYLSTQQGQLAVRPRSSSKKVAQVEINGKVVGNQGIIYLNDRSESVAFKALTQTGAFLEIDTRMNDVDFKDAVQSDNGQRIIMTASGADPADGSKVRRLSDGSWQVALSKERPLLYLKGDGDIPMRQEFYVKGNVPPAKIRPTLLPDSVTKTYSSKVQLEGNAPNDVTVSGDGSDKDANFQSQGSHFTWTISNLPAGKSTRHYVQVQSGSDKFVAGYDIERGNPFSAWLGARYQTPSGIAFGTFGFEWWFENFLGVNSDISHMHWGLTVSRDQHLTTNSSYPEVDLTTAELSLRATPGFHLIDETWGVSLPVQMVQGKDASSMTFGLGAFVQNKPTVRWFKRMAEWTELKLQYFPSGSGSYFKVNSAYRLEGNAYLPMKKDFYLKYGLGLTGYKYEPAGVKEDMQMELNGMAYWKF